MNEHDMKDIHEYMDHPFPRIRSDPITTADPTKMNVIVPIIPESARNVMDFTLLVAGASLNTLLGIVIASNPRMHTPANCYVTSLLLSSMLILVEPLRQVLDRIFDVRFVVNLDYVFLVSFSTSVLTIILLNVEVYVAVCRKSSALHKHLSRISIAVKGVLYIWAMCVMITAMELKLYVHFEEEVMFHIYETSTIMFLVFPCFIFVTLDSFILYDLTISKLMDGAWPREDTGRFVILVGITVGYFLTMIPYRVATAITLVTESCCSEMTIEITYTMVKMYPLILPITYLVTSKELCRLIEKMLACRPDEILIAT